MLLYHLIARAECTPFRIHRLDRTRTQLEINPNCYRRMDRTKVRQTTCDPLRSISHVVKNDFLSYQTLRRYYGQWGLVGCVPASQLLLRHGKDGVGGRLKAVIASQSRELVK